MRQRSAAREERQGLFVYRGPLYQLRSRPDAHAHGTIAGIALPRPTSLGGRAASVGDIRRAALGPITPPTGGQPH